MTNFSIASTARKYPKLPYEEIKEAILGKNYYLSLTFVGTKRAQELNQAYRQKSYSPNVLSFPLDEKTGEIFITPVVAKREAKKFGMTPNGYIGFLFVHGCLHLKGHDHSDKMDNLEKKYCQQFSLK